MPHLFYFSMGQGPSTHPSGSSPEEKAVEYGPHALARLGGNVRSLSNRIREQSIAIAKVAITF